MRLTNRGFQVMLPQPVEEDEVFKHEIRFILFDKEFSLYIQVKPAQKSND